MSAPIPVAIAVVVHREEQRILLGKRKNKDQEYGLYGFPGGKVGDNEALIDCVKRETEEETNIIIVGNPYCLGWKEEFLDKYFLSFFFYVDQYENEPKLMEPDKCFGWGWWNVYRLPPENQQTLALKILCKSFLPWIKNTLQIREQDA